MEKIKVLILDVASEERSMIAQMLLNVEYMQLYDEVDSVEDAMDIIEQAEIDVVLIGVNVEGDGFAVSDKISTEFSDIGIILLSDEFHEEAVHKAFFSGVRDILIKPVEAAKLVDSIYKTNESVKIREQNRKEVVTRARPRAGAGQIFTVFGNKGGIGRTFFSINFAVALAKETKSKVVLVDLDLDFGNVALGLNIVPKFTISDVVDDIRNIDQDFIESYLIPHESGIKILPANSQPMSDEFVNAEDIDIILRTLQSAYDYIVIDTPVVFADAIKPAVVLADQLLMITTPEVAAVRNIKSEIISLTESNFPKGKMKIILNKVSRNDKIKQKDVEATLNQEVFATIRSDVREVAASMNLGVPYILSNKTSGIRKDILSIVSRVVKKPNDKDKGGKR